MTTVRIASGRFKGYIGHLSYDEDEQEWVTFYTAGGWWDVQADWIPI